MPEYFRVELSQFISLLRRKITEKYRKGVRNIRWRSNPCYFLSAGKCVRLCNTHLCLNMFFSGLPYQIIFLDVYSENFSLLLCETYQLQR